MTAALGTVDTAVFRPVRSRNAFEETVEVLEEAIALGIVPAGTRFPPERQLMEQLQVSRSTLREALRVLQRAGYVRSERGRSGGTIAVARAEELTGRDARRIARELGGELPSLLDQRRVLEPGAAELAAERATKTELEALYRLARADASSGGADFRHTHAQIHLGIARLSHTPAIVSAIAHIHFRLSDLLAAIRLAQVKIRTSNLAHLRVLDAIAARDPREARELMTEHILVSDRFLRTYARH